MSETDGWFVDGDTFTVDVENASGDKAQIVMRKSNGGLRARVAEAIALRTEEAGLRSPPASVVELVTVQESIVSWTLPGPAPTAQRVAALNDDLLDLLFVAYAIGEDPAKAAERAQADAKDGGGGDPTEAAAAPPTGPKRRTNTPAAAPAAPASES